MNSGKSKFTISQFLERFPTNEACLEEVKANRWPDGIYCKKCEKVSNHYKVKSRKTYSCQWCGSHVSPLAGTIFDKSSTSLKLWFYAMYLMIQTRSGTSAKQLERELGVTYKTAWRMFKQIRMLMSETGDPLTGTVEIDETFIGGKGHNRKRKWVQGVDDKEILMGMLQRGGKVYLKHIPNTGKWTLLDQIKENVSPKARVLTDEFPGYTQLTKQGYKHHTVNHQLEFVKGDIHTQAIEGFWSQFKRGLYGVYRFCGKKYLQAYSDEYAFRYNHRNHGGRMFDVLLGRVATVKMVRA